MEEEGSNSQSSGSFPASSVRVGDIENELMGQGDVDNEALEPKAMNETLEIAAGLPQTNFTVAWRERGMTRNKAMMLAHREALRLYYQGSFQVELSGQDQLHQLEAAISDEPSHSSNIVLTRESSRNPEIEDTDNPQIDDFSSYSDVSSDAPEDESGADVRSSDKASVFSEEENKYTMDASPDSKFESYSVLVDPGQNDKAVDIPLYSTKRPHMRAFHLAWASFFVAFFNWFAITPLLGDIARTLDLGGKEIWTSSVLAVSSSAVTRLLMGPLCDRYGARRVMSGVLVAAAVPTALAGWSIQDETSLYLTRLFIGVAGSSFVSCEFWTSSMFTQEIAGTAMALAAGWGNLAGGICQIVMGSLLFPLFKVIYGGSGYQHSHGQEGSVDEVDISASMGNTTNDELVTDSDQDRPAELAWRTILVFPAITSIIMAWLVMRFGDDTPKGNVETRKLDPVSVRRSFSQATCNPNTWVLFVHYACCFGVEITMYSAAALYFQEEFGQSTESAAAIASVFGWMNLFARGIGGFGSDMSNARSGMRGRLRFQFLMLICEGALVVLFAHTYTLASAIVVMILFSTFVQAAEGSTFGIVPYVDANVTGSVVGVVGAGGNVGGACFALMFRALGFRSAFMWMGISVMACAFGTVCVAIPSHRGLVAGEDASCILEHRRKAKLPAVIVIQPTPPTTTFLRATDNATVNFEEEEHG